MQKIDKSTALNIVLNNIEKGAESYHQDYEHTTNLASLYKKLITGDDIDSLLLRYNPRETEDQFKQRKRITQLVTPAITEKIKSPFYKVSRIDNVKRSIVFEEAKTTTNNNNVKEITKAMTSFYGDESLDDFMESQYIDTSFIDPNAFIMVTFDGVVKNTDKTKAKPFPVIIPSHNAINYKYINNKLQYLVVRKGVTFEVAGETITGEELRIYTKDFIIKAREIEDTRERGKHDDFVAIGLDITTLNDGKEHKITVEERLFVVQLFTPKAGQIQACRVGYKRDATTNGRTFVNPFHSAVNRMMKSIKSTSELDLTMALHTFPQKAQYVPKCAGAPKDTCDNGQARNGTCSICNGTGLDITKSAQEMLTLPMPRDKDDMMDLDKLVTYKSPDVSLVEFMDKYLVQLENQAMQDVFVSESFNRITMTKTATEKELDMESVYDTLLPFANKYSAVWRKLVTLTATFIDKGKGITVTHTFPKDFKLKTVNALIDDRQKAMTAQTPAYLLQEIDNDLAIKLYADNSKALNEYQIKQQHIPFKGKTVNEIQIAINMNLTTEHDKILWSNFDAIFGDLEAVALEAGKDFYSFSYDDRVQLIDAKILEYTTMINGAQGGASDIDFGAAPDVEDVLIPLDIEAEAKAKLRGTVGGIDAIINVNLAVGRGQMTERAAEAMLVKIFGFNTEDAAVLIDPVKILPPTAE